VVQLQRIVDTRHTEMRDAHARDVKAINKVQYSTVARVRAALCNNRRALKQPADHQ
jgi:hypothetical protein